MLEKLRHYMDIDLALFINAFALIISVSFTKGIVVSNLSFRTLHEEA